MWGIFSIIVCFAVINTSVTHGSGEVKLVRLIPVGEVEEGLLRELASSLEERLEVVAEVVPGIEVPPAAYNAWRKQYFSTRILDALHGMEPNSRTYLLGVTELDLYVPALNYVFGEALPLRNVAIISLHRLREEFYGGNANREVLVERMVKEAVHELGHVWGMRHCPDPDCVMFFSNSLADTDRKSDQFCPKCKSINKRYGR